MATNKAPSVSGMRFTPADRKIIEALRRKLGLGMADIVRLGLRALATKEGLSA